MENEEMIRSRSDLFKGQMVRKPPRALIVGHDPKEGDVYQCPTCGHQDTAEGCGVIGAEPGCLFCNDCNLEFEA